MNSVTLAVAIVIGLAAGLLAAPPEVVTVTLRDGTRLEGVIREESPAEIRLETSEAGGSIVSTRAISRTDIASIAGLSAAEKARRAAEVAYQATRPYKLSPQTVFQEAYYTEVIDKVLRPFVEQYPDSPHADAVSEQLAEWTAERQRVMAGEIKFRGQWLPQAEAAAIQEMEQAGQALDAARRLMQRGHYELAQRELQPHTTDEARSLRIELYRAWIRDLEDRRDKAADKVRQTESAMQRIREAAHLPAPATPGSTDVERSWVGRSSEEIKAANIARAQLLAASNDWRRARAELRGIEEAAVRVRSLAAQAGATEKDLTSLSSAQAVTKPVPTESATDDWSTPRLLSQIRDFAVAWWPAAAVLLAGLLWYFTRKLNR